MLNPISNLPVASTPHWRHALPQMRLLADPVDFTQWAKTLYLTLKLLNLDRYILRHIRPAHANEQGESNYVMLPSENSLSGPVKRCLIGARLQQRQPRAQGPLQLVYGLVQPSLCSPALPH